MTAPTWLPEQEEELSPEPLMLTAPVATSASGFAEIKKHNSDGISQGLNQLRTSNEKRYRQRYLITYLPLNRTGRPADARKATKLRVFALRFKHHKDLPPPGERTLQRRAWMDLGIIQLPEKSAWFPFPSGGRDDQFGNAVEEAVRQRFIQTVVKNRPNPQHGGARGSTHDVLWDELADFYRELAAELAPSGGSFRF
jgi:hypothetical protein